MTKNVGFGGGQKGSNPNCSTSPETGFAILSLEASIFSSLKWE